MHGEVLVRSLVDRGLLLLTGPDRKRFLHGMVTNDVKGLEPGAGCHAAMLTVKGKLLADLQIYDRGEDLLLSMEGEVREKLRVAMERYLIMDDVTITEPADLGVLGVYGEGAAFAIATVLGLGSPGDLAGLAVYRQLSLGEPPVTVSRTGELGIPGYHLYGSKERLVAHKGALLLSAARELAPNEAELLRIEAGVPRYGFDMDEDRLPMEANLDHAVSFTKGCYLGQEVIARLSARGHVNRRLMGLVFAGLPEPPPRGTGLVHESKDNAGTVMSGAISPRYGVIALGYVHRSLWEPGTRLQVAGADPSVHALVTALPFHLPTP